MDIDKDDRLFSIILLVTVILLLFTVALLYMSKEGEKGKRIHLQKQLDTAITERQALEQKVRDTETAHAQALVEIRGQEEKISALLREIDDMRSTHTANMAKIQAKEFEIEGLKAKLDEIRAERQNTLTDLEKLNERHLNLKFQMETLMKTKEELEKRAQDLADKEGVSLGTVVIKQSRN